MEFPIFQFFVPVSEDVFNISGNSSLYLGAMLPSSLCGDTFPGCPQTQWLCIRSFAAHACFG